MYFVWNYHIDKILNSVYSLFQVTDYLSANAPVDLGVYRILVQNSFGMYAAWTTLAFLLNVNVAAIHDGGMSDQTSSLTCLSILTAVIALWSVLSLTIWDRYVRYMLTPLLSKFEWNQMAFVFYNLVTRANFFDLCNILPALGWGLMGIVVKLKKKTDLKGDTGSVTFVTVLLGLTVVLLLLHIITMVYRHRRKPLYVPSP